MRGNVIKYLDSWRRGAGAPVSSSRSRRGGAPAWAPRCGPKGGGGGAPHAKGSCGRDF